MNYLKKIATGLAIIIVSLGVGFNFNSYLNQNIDGVVAEDLELDDQEATIRAIQKVMPAVVSILVYEDVESVVWNMTTGEKSIVEDRVQQGSGTGFLISSDGMILTNKHVVNAATDETEAIYQVILSSDKQYYAQLIDKDPINDLAILKIFDKDLPHVEFGDSDNLQVGTTVIAIGNTLGVYQNSVTKGIVSGLNRSIVASDQYGNIEPLDNAIQTDAEINFGNSGGPLVNLQGQVVGINTAIDQSGSSLGFAIPVSDALTVINSTLEVGRIVRPRLGLRYVMLTPEIASENKLNRDSGAYVIEGEDGEEAVFSGSPAEDAGIQVGDIIFEINAVEVDEDNTLLSIIQKYKPGDKIGMKILRGDTVLIKVVELDEFVE